MHDFVPSRLAINEPLSFVRTLRAPLASFPFYPHRHLKTHPFDSAELERGQVDGSHLGLAGVGEGAHVLYAQGNGYHGIRLEFALEPCGQEEQGLSRVMLRVGNCAVERQSGSR